MEIVNDKYPPLFCGLIHSMAQQGRSEKLWHNWTLSRITQSRFSVSSSEMPVLFEAMHSKFGPLRGATPPPSYLSHRAHVIISKPFLYHPLHSDKLFQECFSVSFLSPLSAMFPLLSHSICFL